MTALIMTAALGLTGVSASPAAASASPDGTLVLPPFEQCRSHHNVHQAHRRQRQ
jgi:hypothetical protein